MDDELRQRIADRFTVVELVELFLDVSIDEFLDAFEEKWTDNAELIRAVGMEYDGDESD